MQDLNVKVKYIDNVFRPLTETSDFKNGAEYWMEIKKDSRSLSQNNLLWMYCQIAGDETGNSKECIYEEMINMFSNNIEEPNLKTGEVKIRKKRPSQMNIGECSIYIDKIIEFWKDFNSLILPNPQDFYKHNETKERYLKNSNQIYEQ